jgi:epoxyqueuosine reductase
VEIAQTPPFDRDCGSCRLCIDACPTDALAEAGTLDATRCLSYWTQSGGSIPEEIRPELGDAVYGCDICQDVCPWNRGVERRRADAPLPAGAEPVVSLADWIERDPDELRRAFDRLYVPRNDGRLLQRNALVALGNGGSRDDLPLLDEVAAGEDALLAEHAAWAASHIRERSAAEEAGA